ncbi:Uncharacterized HTH-type transcriptional regulator yjiR [Burkholderia stabilis]|uniref:Uncharacterized HTH-type transcriptional regulator yjiR n=1 Tax=Burkholderia stabilis TaxID=95485 RepID=A0AAJ5N8S4_9BURK|nr:Uncharacterized HTH-type transcriptional regulator yjiR [Burkholderia stabilis]
MHKTVRPLPPRLIVMESPTFYAMLHAIERVGMKAIEVATHPEYGIDIAACMVMPNFQIPDERKRELVEFAMKARMPIIENVKADNGSKFISKALDKSAPKPLETASAHCDQAATIVWNPDPTTGATCACCSP